MSSHFPLACRRRRPTQSQPISQILTIHKSLLAREKTAEEIAQAFLGRLRRTEPQLKRFLYVAPDEVVLKQAGEIDWRIRDSEEVGPLAGVLVGVKDNICTSDMPSTAGSKILENYRPPYDATCVKKLRENGAIIVGKTNLDEFGMGSTTEGSAYQGIPDFASQFISNNYMDSKPLKGLRVGIIRETVEDGVDAEVVSSIQAAVSHLEDLGCTVSEVSFPSFSLGLPAYYTLVSSESSSNLARFDGVRFGTQVSADELSSLYGCSRAEGFGSEVKLRILMGTTFSWLL